MGYSYQRNEAIIRSKTKELFGVGAVVTASSYLVLVVDFMLIGWILGADAVAAAGLCDSFVDVAEFPGFVISSSGPIAAGILMGKRQYRQADGVFTLSFLTALAGGILCWCLLPFCDFFGSLLAGGDSAIAAEASRYTFFVIAASPFIALNLVISQFAILDNHFRLAMSQVITANAVNIVLDIVLMKFLHMGVAGASAASMAGNIAGIAVGLPYLLSRKRTFHFTLKIRELREVTRALSSASVSFSVDKASRIFSTLIVNLLLMHYTGSIGVALYAVCGRLKFVLRILAGEPSRLSPIWAACSMGNVTFSASAICFLCCSNTPMPLSSLWSSCWPSFPQPFSALTASMPMLRGHIPFSPSVLCC